MDEKYGLIGKDLSHSFSKKLHESLDSSMHYELIELQENELANFFTKRDFKGINVTIPYKQEVLKFLDVIDPLCLKINACNTIVCKNNQLYGYNSDYYGFKKLLIDNLDDYQNQTYLILGNGGAAQAVKWVLNDLNIKYDIVSRNPLNNCISYDTAYQNSNDYSVIINTTPLGMNEYLNEQAIDLNYFKNCIAVIDLIYNPSKTCLLKQAETLNIKAINGLEMLIEQAKVAQKWFKE